jgi:outer membrane protein OmpA-like peptidoglycan-associated protein
MPIRTLALSVLALTLAACSPGAIADRVTDRVTRDIDYRVERRATDIARRTLDLAEDAIVCVVTDQACIEDARAQGQEPVVVNEDGEPVSGYPSGGTAAGGSASSGSAGSPGGAGSAPDPGAVWANYDFVPGERVLFVHDFEGTRVGNFPSRIDYIAGNLDVVRLGEGDDATNVLRVGEGGDRGGNGCFTIDLPETLPEQFTLEFRTMTTDPQLRDRVYVLSAGSVDRPDTRCTYPPPTHLEVRTQYTGLKWPDGGESGEPGGYRENEWASVALGCDGDYCKLFVDGERKANVPRWEFPRASAIHVYMNVYRHSLYLDDLRIAEGGQRSLYDDLEANGELSTTAIRFDSGSATIRPESGGYLAQVVEMMQAHPSLRVEIQGHTDSDGSDTFNQGLSERRAAAVKDHLVAAGVEGGRMTTVGFGESQPAAANDTPEGMAANRRVVFRRL